MATEIDQLLVSLEARIDQFEKSFRKASNVANTSWREIEQRGEQGAKKLESTFDAATRNVSEKFRLLATSAAGALTAALGVNQIRKWADEWTSAGSKIAAAGEEMDKVAARQSQLTDIALRSRASLSSVVDLYTGLTRSTKEMGASGAQVAKVTELISKAFATSGASTDETKGAILQLNQALAAGALRGDELNSVMEQAPPIARLIAKEFGVSIGELKGLGEQGKLTADRVFSAILKGAPQIEAEFSKTTATIAQSLQMLETSFTRWIGQFDQATGASGVLSGAIQGLASHMEVTGVLAATLGAALIGAFAGGPIGAGIAAATTALVGFGAQLRPIQSELANLADYAAVAWRLIREKGGQAAQWLQQQFARAAELISSAMGGDAVAGLKDLLSGVKTTANAVLNAFVFAAREIEVAWDHLGAAIAESIIAAMNKVIEYVEGAANKVVDSVNRISSGVNSIAGTKLGAIDHVDLGRISNSYAGAGKAAGKAFGDAFEELHKDRIGDALKATESALDEFRNKANCHAIERTFGAKSSDPGANDGQLDAALKTTPAKAKGAGKSKAATEKDSEFERKIAELEKSARAYDLEAESIGKNAREVEKAKIAFELLEAAKKSNIPVTDELRSKVDALSDSYANAKVSVDETRQRQEEMKAAAHEVASTLAEGFKAAVIEGEKLSSVLEKLWKKLAGKLVDHAFNSIVDGIFSSDDKKGGGGGFGFGGFLSGLFASFTKKAGGGLIQGPGGPRTDSIPAMLSHGEYVVNADATAKFAPLLEAINSGKGLRLAAGGIVAPPSIAPAPTIAGPTVASATAAAPQFAIHNYASGVEVKPQLSEGKVAIIVRHLIEENNVRLPGILGDAERRAG